MVGRTLLLLLLVSGAAVVVPTSIARAADQTAAAENSANSPEQNKNVVQQLADLRARVEKLEGGAEKNQMEPMKCCRLGMKGTMGQGREAPKPEQK